MLNWNGTTPEGPKDKKTKTGCNIQFGRERRAKGIKIEEMGQNETDVRFIEHKQIPRKCDDPPYTRKKGVKFIGELPN